MIAATAVVGAATRLTGSGLSITEWAPILGVIPPLDDAQWQAAFARYKAIPQYEVVNKGMSLEAFRAIYWWEWGHRLIARTIGIVFLLPFVYFLVRGRIPRSFAPMLCAIFLLGALQGAVGWYMVSSGLVGRVDVSQYRLAMHLGLAVALLGLVVWAALRLAPLSAAAHLATVTRGQRRTAAALLALVYLQILAGALVAGLKAGLSYNTWPLMDGALVPAGLWHLSPGWANLFENHATVQFTHRGLAYLVACLALWQAIDMARTADDERIRQSAAILAVAVLAQAALGIWTLLAWVPIGLGVAHQAGAMAVFCLAVWHLHTVSRSPLARQRL